MDFAAKSKTKTSPWLKAILSVSFHLDIWIKKIWKSTENPKPILCVNKEEATKDIVEQINIKISGQEAMESIAECRS